MNYKRVNTVNIMDPTKIVLCRLCLQQANDNNFPLGEIKSEMISVVNPDLELYKTRDPRICSECVDMLQELFDFKSNILEIDDSLQNYRNSNNSKSLPHEDTDSAEDGSIFGIIRRNKACRTCLQLTNDNFENTLDENNGHLRRVFKKCLPELVTEITVNYILCRSCFKILEKYDQFLEQCNKVENNIRTYCEVENSNHIELSKLLTYYSSAIIKVENNVDVNCADNISLQSIKIEEEEVHIKDEEDEEEDDNTEKPSSFCISEEKLYHCAHCPYQARLKQTLRKHLLTHARSDRIKMYSCPMCPYKSKRSDHLRIHTFRRHEIQNEESNVHKCTICPYVSQVKANLDKHALSHKSHNVDKLFKCAFCPFQTKYKFNMSMHRLRHDTSDKAMNKCTLCGFQTRIERNLKRHMLCHQDDDVKLYKCQDCSYQTKRKNNLRSHTILKHDNNGLKPFKCDVCNYETSQKYVLNKHKLSHSKKIYKCQICPFETKNSSYFQRHKKLHEASDNANIFTCAICHYITDYKKRLRDHMKNHKQSKRILWL